MQDKVRAFAIQVKNPIPVASDRQILSDIRPRTDKRL